MTDIQRIRKVLNWLIFSEFAENDTDLAIKLGYTKSSFSQIVNGKVPLSDKFINALCLCDENINKVWILTGEGNLLKHTETPLQIITEKTEVHKATPLNKKTIPFVRVTAIGGFGNKDFAIQESDIKEYYVIPKFKHKKIDFMIEVEGSSMYPKYNSGDVVACTIIKESSFIQWNKTHVIATKEQGIIIKRLKKSEIENNLIMISDNSSYEPFEVSKKDILGIALVVGVIRLE